MVLSGGNSALDVKPSAYLRGSIALLNTPSCTPYAMSVGITAQLSPPSSEAAQSAFLRLMAKGRIDRSTMLESSSTRPSSRISDSPIQRVKV